MNEAKVTPLGDGEPMAMCEETGVAQVTQRKGVEAVKAQVHARITHVGSEYRKDVTSGTCKLCITDWVVPSSPSASSGRRSLHPRLRNGRALRRFLHSRRRLGRGEVRPPVLAHRG